MSEASGLLAEGRYDEARLAALGVLARDPAHFEATVALCKSFFALGRPADAENYASKAYALRKDARLAFYIGQAQYELGRNKEALRNLETYVGALNEGVEAGKSYYFMGEIYLRLGRYGHADIALTAALQYEPENALWWSRLGWAREKAADFSSSLAAYETALKLNPRLEDAALGRTRVRSKVRF